MNHNLQLLQSLYLAASGKYRKYKVRLDKAVHTGRFYKLNKRKQSYLVSRLRKLYEKLKSLQTQLRIAGASAALTLTLAVANPAQSQSTLGPFERNDALNPLPPPVVIPHPRPAVADIDNDGDLDVFVGNIDGDIKFYRNDSPAGKVARFTELTGSDNPLDGVNEGTEVAPALADVDKDGDFDLLLGNSDGDTFFFRNTGTPTSPVFVQQIGSNNPFDGITGTHSPMYGNRQAIPSFVDFDEDSDIDLFIGSSYIYDIETGSHPAVEYYENNAGVFSQTPVNGLGGALEFLSEVTITFADVNNDSGIDAIVGTSGSNYVRCFVQGIEAQFNEQTGTWDPNAKTGNPFDNFYVYKYSAPIAADFDGDGDLDFLVGVQTNYDNDHPSVRYFENTDGNFSLEYKTQLNISPFGGVDVGGEATPVFADLDNDGDLDAVLGEKYGGAFSIFLNTDGRLYADPEHPLTDILGPLSQTYDVIPVFADIDNDGDQDLFASMDREIAFFRNDNGIFENEVSPINPSSRYNMSLAFIDVDKDGDLDALIGNYSYYGVGGVIEYFQNNGTASAPDFDAATAPSPFDVINFEENPTIFSVDIDHDGDTDLIVTDTYYHGWYSDGYASRTLFYENNGDGTFTESPDPLLTENTPESFTSYADIDGDGDLDAFLGNGYSFDFDQDGKVFYFENTNPEPLTETESSDLTAIGGSPIIITPTLTITDADNDDITFATVSISDFILGEVLDFSPQAGITGVFDDELGVLTFIGKAPIATYETLLRSVTYNFTGTVPGGRKSKSSRINSIIREITFEAFDTDFTAPVASSRSINVLATNSPPIITPEPITITSGFIVTSNILPLITDIESNFTPSTSTVTITQQPISGAVASLIFVSESVVNLEVDYTGISFAGVDELRIEACDDLGACTTSTIEIQADLASEIAIYNALSPNNDDNLNPFFKIEYIETVSPENTVTIYNRWGDVVFECKNYNNSEPAKRFEGVNKNGKDLPSGTYFYKIEITGKTVTGYLSLKR